MLNTVKCGYCGKIGTRSVVIEPDNATHRHVSISCKWCGSILGVTGFHDAGTLLLKQEEKIARLEQAIEDLRAQNGQIGLFLSQVWLKLGRVVAKDSSGSNPPATPRPKMME